VLRKRRTEEQAQSSLLGKLPGEVRRMVWGYVSAPGEMSVGNKVQECERWVGMGSGMDEGAFGDALRCRVKEGFRTEVLRTCRRV
jgi:hypothetical protein